MTRFTFELRRAGRGLWQLWTRDGQWTDGVRRDRQQAEAALAQKQQEQREIKRWFERRKGRLL